MEICETALEQFTDCTEQVTESLSKLENPKTKLQNLQLPLSLSLCHLEEAFVDGCSLYMLPRVISQSLVKSQTPYIHLRVWEYQTQYIEKQ